MKPESPSFSLRIPADHYNKIKAYAEDNDLTIAQVIRKCIKEFFRQLEEK